MAGVIEIRVPDLGDFKGVTVIDLLVKPGDAVEVDTPLVTLETDKATMDVPSSAAGIVEKLHIAKGGKVSAGDLVATLRAQGEAAKSDQTAVHAPPAAAMAEAPKPVPARPAAAAMPPPPAPPAAPAGPTGPVEVRVPDMGDFKEVAVIDVLVKPGDAVEVEAPLVTLETDKATMDVPSTVAGIVEKVHVAKGGKISPGDVVVTVRGSVPQASTPSAAAAAPAPVASRAAAPVAEAPKAAAAAARFVGFDGTLPAIDEPGFSRAHAGPSVRKLAREMGVNLVQVAGTGIKGRITHDDVKAYVKKVLTGAGTGAGGSGRALPAVPEVDFSRFGPVETKPLSRIQKISGPRLQASWLNIPHVTQFDEADITALEDVRTKLKQKASREGIKLTPLAFVMRACVKALQEFPQFNASLDASGENLVLKKYIHIGFAADTPNGLVVPVVRDADRCDVYEIARKLAELAEKARAGKLTSAEMQGGSFTISSLGGIGGTAFTPIVNAPEVAILGVSRSSMKPVFENGAFVARLMLPLSLSYDHRVIDGAAGARFSAFLVKTLSDPRALTEAVP
jgi:pyruvate dehydrogenase E2 component (dihydrolipoamide acetyltransferase)